MLYLKAFHIIFVITWFAGLFYLPRLYVYHAMSSDAVSIERFKVMERKLFWGIMTPSAVLAVVAVAVWLPFSPAAKYLGFVTPPPLFFVILAVRGRERRCVPVRSGPRIG